MLKNLFWQYITLVIYCFFYFFLLFFGTPIIYWKKNNQEKNKPNFLLLFKNQKEKIWLTLQGKMVLIIWSIFVKIIQLLTAHYCRTPWIPHINIGTHQ